MINFKENIDKEVTISGFAEKVRNLQWVQFIVLRAEGKRIQITIEKSEEKNKEMVEIVNNLTNEYKNGNITIEEYNEEALPLNYELTKRKLPVNVITCVIIIGYYIVFAYFNKGQTLGKKLLKIKVVNDKGERPSIWNMVIRGLLIYGIVTTLYSTISINFLDMEKFNYSVSVISAIESMIIIVSILMMLYKKDGRGLHDIIAKTNVIREE